MMKITNYKLQIEDSRFKIPNYRLKIANCRLQIGRKLLGRAKLMPNACATNHLTPNTLITFPQYLKLPVRFWTTNVGHEIRSSFDLELYEKVCEARGVTSGVK